MDLHHAEMARGNTFQMNAISTSITTSETEGEFGVALKICLSPHPLPSN